MLIDTLQFSKCGSPPIRSDGRAFSILGQKSIISYPKITYTMKGVDKKWVDLQ